MGIRLTKNDRARIESDQELIAQLHSADVIATVHTQTGAIQALWKRTLPDTELPDAPRKIIVLTFDVSSAEEFAEYQAIVHRLKTGDGGNASSPA